MGEPQRSGGALDERRSPLELGWVGSVDRASLSTVPLTAQATSPGGATSGSKACPKIDGPFNRMQ